MWFKKVFIIWLFGSLFSLINLSSVSASNSALTTQIMDMLTQRIPQEVLVTYFDSWTLLNLNKTCQDINNKQIIADYLNTKFNTTNNKKIKLKILLKWLYLYECIWQKRQDISNIKDKKQLDIVSIKQNENKSSSISIILS